MVYLAEKPGTSILSPLILIQTMSMEQKIHMLVMLMLQTVETTEVHKILLIATVPD